jgi:hypothetical protein
MVRVSPLHGGTSSAMHAVDVRDRAGHVHSLVLRRFVDDEWRAEEPDAPRTEAAALTLLESRPLPTPRLVALGEVDGIPLLLMTRLPGALVWQPTDVVPTCAAWPTPVAAELPPDEPYALEAQDPPDDSPFWRGAFAIFHGAAPQRRAARRAPRLSPLQRAVGRRGDQRRRRRASVRIGAPEVDVAGRDSYDPYRDVVATLGGRDQEDLAGLDAGDRALLQRAVGER